jgi:integrase
MSALRQALADYLRIRRALGYKLERAENLLAQYLDFLERLEEERVTIANAVGWATLPAPGSGHWWAFRMSVVRGFASYLHALNAAHEVPPADLLPNRVHRAIPYLYSEEEIVALMAATSSLRFPLRQATYRTLVGLLSVTGMRVGEAIRLDRSDVDLGHGVLTVRQTKFGKTRELPLHASTVGVLRAYLRLGVSEDLCRHERKRASCLRERTPGSGWRSRGVAPAASGASPEGERRETRVPGMALRSEV